MNRPISIYQNSPSTEFVGFSPQILVLRSIVLNFNIIIEVGLLTAFGAIDFGNTSFNHALQIQDNLFVVFTGTGV